MSGVKLLTFVAFELIVLADRAVLQIVAVKRISVRFRVLIIFVIRKHFISETVSPSPYCKNTFFCFKKLL